MQLNKLALEALCRILNSISRRVHADLLRELGLASMDHSVTMMDSFMMNSMADMGIQNQSVTGSVAQLPRISVDNERMPWFKSLNFSMKIFPLPKCMTVWT